MDIIMPKMGESVTEGTIIKWRKKVGDSVKHDEIIFEISTDKVDTEIPSPISGVISEIIINEGETVEVGTVVARIESESNQIENKKDKAIEVEDKINVTENPQRILSGENIIEIAMPKMGESVMEGTIIKWHKKVGENVKKDETIFEISTDKVDTEIPSPENGILSEILVGEQETVEVGTIVAKLSIDGKVQIVERKQKVLKALDTTLESMHDNFSKSVIEVPEKRPEGSNFLSPLVLSIAQKENINFAELQSINGTGIDGRVSKKDVLSYLEQRKSGKIKSHEISKRIEEKVIHHSSVSSLKNSNDVEKIPMDNIRQRIKEHMVLSRDTSVHVTELVEVDMTRVHNFINANKDEIFKNENVKITYMAFIADAVVKTIKKYPLINSSIDGETILQKKFINLGIAVAVEPTGLIVPNIKNAGDKNIIGLAKSIVDIASRARNKKLTPDDIANGTFSITNYGVFGTIFGTPIINQPEVAILGIGAVQKKPVVIEVDGTDTIAIRNIMALTLSHDHRLIDGMLGGLFLKSVKEILENFDSETFH